nr:M15 family metallopeptidase [uncultured Mediterraneibacter sp.]
MTDKYLTLVNMEHPIFRPVDRSELARPFKDYPHILMERTAASALRKLLSDIGGGDAIIPVSGWRSRREQKKIWTDTVAEKGVAFARKYVALPACSEHETGLAIDLALKAPDIDFICPEFPQTGICQIFRERAPHYGFIQRYSKEKEFITGIGEEPWHFRYVGTPHAVIMTEKKMSLEEYTDSMREDPAGDFSRYPEIRYAARKIR